MSRSNTITIVVKDPSRIYEGRRIGTTEILELGDDRIVAYKHESTYVGIYEEGATRVDLAFVCEGVQCAV